jgi:hypothetical protein
MIKLILPCAGVSSKLRLTRSVGAPFELAEVAATGRFVVAGTSTIQRKTDYPASGLKSERPLCWIEAPVRAIAGAKVMSHYSLRNQIAHGTLLAQRIDLDAVKEFFQIQGELKD